MDMSALKQAIQGSWRLAGYEERPVDGSATTHPLGKHPAGFIIYNADGFMSALLSPTDKTVKASPISYAGPYDLDEKRQIVRQQSEASISPEWIGQIQERKVRFEGDKLILSTVESFTLAGRTAHAVITWQKAKP